MSKRSQCARHLFVLCANALIVALVFVASAAKGSNEASPRGVSSFLAEGAGDTTVRAVQSSADSCGSAWYLAVLNGGQVRPGRVIDRSAEPQPTHRLASAPRRVARLVVQPATIGGQPSAYSTFAIAGGVPVVGDFNGDGAAEVAVYHRGVWFVDLNGDGLHDASDLRVELGGARDQPITGDWDNDGKTDIGVCSRPWPSGSRPVWTEPGLPDADNRVRGLTKNQPVNPLAVSVRWAVHRANADAASLGIDHIFCWGKEGHSAVAGDFNGDGVSTIGSFHNGRWRLDVNGDGRFDGSDAEFVFGKPGDVPLVGDFDGDGMDEVAVFRNGTWIIDADNDRAESENDLTIQFGDGRQLPLVGDFDGDGVDDLALYAIE